VVTDCCGGGSKWKKMNCVGHVDLWDPAKITTRREKKETRTSSRGKATRAEGRKCGKNQRDMADRGSKVLGRIWLNEKKKVQLEGKKVVEVKNTFAQKSKRDGNKEPQEGGPRHPRLQDLKGPRGGGASPLGTKVLKVKREAQKEE